MAILRITNFGGEIPRVSARALPEGAAQVNSNLLATSTEFRPLLDDGAVAVSVASGTKTLHRMARVQNTWGILGPSDETSGWLSSVADRNYVKGQLNDDANERTYISTNDGTAPLKALDVNLVERQLGVPPPAKPTVAPIVVSQFTLSDANTWYTGTLLPSFKSAILGGPITTSIPGATPATIIVGATIAEATLTPDNLHGMGLSSTASDLNCSLTLADATAKGLNDAGLGVVSGSNFVFDLMARPKWATLNQSYLAANLAYIPPPRVTDPVTTTLFTSAMRTKLASQAGLYYDKTVEPVKSLLTQLDSAVSDFMAAVTFSVALGGTLTYNSTGKGVIHLNTPIGPGSDFTEPGSEPAKELYTQVSGNGQDAEWGYTLNPAWTVWDTQRSNWAAAMAAYGGTKATTSADQAKLLSSALKAKAESKRITQEIESLYTSRKDDIDTMIKVALDTLGLIKTAANPDGLTAVDPDRIIDTRFYFATFVTDWDEESAPSPVSDKLEIDQNDSVRVTIVTPPAGRNVVKWRLYRSNVGSTSTNFQFVAETSTSTALAYTDVKLGADLGEVCPTVTWLEPPFRTQTNGTVKGNNPHLRGMVGMPNGVMAAFLDNFVAFCEPYVPYAWPVEYQIPIEYEIVGLGVFGQTLFVGTMANPYLISGSDSASMSAQKLDAVQSCVARRSIVAMGGGVLYASPDGLCFASQNGVEVITTALFSREDWQALTPASIFAAAFEGVYYFWYTGTYQGNAGGGCLALDMVAKKLSRVNISATAAYSDGVTDALFYATGASLKKAFSTGRKTGLWKSGRVVLQAQAGFAWLQVDGDQSSGTPVSVTWHRYKENFAGVLIDNPKTYNITNTQPTRVHDGRFIEHEIEVAASTRITKIGLYGSTEELQSG
jgi:hypothetical protein